MRATAVMVVLLGVTLATGVLPLPGVFSGSEHRAASRSAAALPAESALADGIAEPPVDLLGRPVAAEPADPGTPPGAVSDGDGVVNADADADADATSSPAPGHTEPDTPSGTAPTDAAAEDLGRLRIGAVDMDVPLGSLVRTDVVTPPGYRAAYALVPAAGHLPDASSETVVITMHSVRSGFAPGNFLVSARGEVLAPIGTEVEALGARWRITGSEQVPKDQLPVHDEIWTDHPGRLVLITCRQTGARTTTMNTVILAERVP